MTRQADEVTGQAGSVSIYVCGFTNAVLYALSSEQNVL